MHPNEEVIHAYVDGELAGTERHDVEQHLAACAECRRLADDLAEIRRGAASLELRDPPARAWSRIERAIELERQTPSPLDSARGDLSDSRRSRSTMIWLAAAAVLVLATAIGLRFATRSAAPTQPTAAVAPSGTMSAEAVEAELRAAEVHYEKAIKGLEQIATTERSALDPHTAATLQKSLAVIDQAISESRAAVRAQPTSEPAVSSLMDNFKTKLALLQDTVALINEMRKGNEQGTAKIVSGLKQKGD